MLVKGPPNLQQHEIYAQDWFKACDQAMKDIVTKLHHLWLAGRKPRISPECSDVQDMTQ